MWTAKTLIRLGGSRLIWVFAGRTLILLVLLQLTCTVFVLNSNSQSCKIFTCLRSSEGKNFILNDISSLFISCPWMYIFISVCICKYNWLESILKLLFFKTHVVLSVVYTFFVSWSAKWREQTLSQWQAFFINQSSPLCILMICVDQTHSLFSFTTLKGA